MAARGAVALLALAVSLLARDSKDTLKLLSIPVELPIDLNGERITLQWYEWQQARIVATEFCNTHSIPIQECLPQITGMLNERRRVYEQKMPFEWAGKCIFRLNAFSEWAGDAALAEAAFARAEVSSAANQHERAASDFLVALRHGVSGFAELERMFVAFTAANQPVAALECAIRATKLHPQMRPVWAWMNDALLSFGSVHSLSLADHCLRVAFVPLKPTAGSFHAAPTADTNSDTSCRIRVLLAQRAARMADAWARGDGGDSIRFVQTDYTSSADDNRADDNRADDSRADDNRAHSTHVLDEKLFGPRAVATHVRWWYERALEELPLPPADNPLGDEASGGARAGGGARQSRGARHGQGGGKHGGQGGKGAREGGKALEVGTVVEAKYR
jgi:hypothetical protein